MTRTRIALTLLIAGGAVAWSYGASAQTGAPGQDRLVQAPLPLTPPSAPSAPTPPSATSPSAAPSAAQNADSPIGSVATLQGTASVTRNNAPSALQLSEPILKGDVLQTGVDGTLGITFDDETTFTLKPNSRIAVNDFIYQEGGAGNAAVYNVLIGTVAFVAAEVAHTGNMTIDTPTATLGIRGTTGLIEIPPGATAGTVGQVAIKLYPDADGRVGRIEVIGRDGSQLGILSRGATGFAIRPGAPGQRFSAVPLQISAQEAERDRSFVRQTFATREVGRQINIQRRNFQRLNQPRPNQLRPNGLQPQTPRLPGQQLPRGGQLPGLQPRPGQPMQPGARPMLQRQPGGLAPGGRQRQPATRERKRDH
jgi:hypothetical protein